MAEKVIALACAAGMSTSLLVTKMQQAAKEAGKDYEIFARSVAEIDNMLAGSGSHKPDVLLLGPQVAYMKAEVIKKTAAAGVPCDVIKMQDYGMMNGKNVVAAADVLMS
ncbi:PTS sugar transporter subunit IIB [Lactococcus ileimucosae]|uniref:PTS sugar transporter subunit IIB n=1 Tax=Lactococcus ileimucosae TaxID=2941329 RepID=UPI002043D8C0|nr:PTS sugar transporter subunit IIB [Lactococcus ileimucosae]